MPTPIGHALGGLLVGLVLGAGAVREDTRSRIGVPDPPHPPHLPHLPNLPDLPDLPYLPDPPALIWPALAACLPDLDFLWGRHNLETHSIGFAVLLGLGVWLVTRKTRLSLICTIAVGTHVLFDWLGSDDSPPLGVMALWPMNTEFYFANAFIFEAISRRYWLPNFFTHNLLAVLRELVILLPAVGFALFLRRSRRSQHR